MVISKKSKEMSKSNKLSFNATWSMAVGGMVGGGIFSVMGLIVQIAGQWAWLSFLISGVIGFISAWSYCHMAIKFKESGGAFTYLRKMDRKGFAGSLAWVLILGYILSVSVYGFTFGHYVAHAFHFGDWFPRVLAFGVIGILTLVNLRSVGDSSTVEIVTVWGKLMVLMALAVFGLLHWDTPKLTEGISPKSIGDALSGAATIFIGYQGFQLLTYDYNAIHKPEKTLPRATLSAVLSVIVIYLAVCLGTTMLVGAETVIKQKEIALSVAGQKAIGKPGMILVTIAAAFSTASAINATLFSTSRLVDDVARKNDLPSELAKENKAKMPYFALLLISSLSILLAVIGSLSSLVSAASLIFLFAFGVVNWIAYQEKIRYYKLSLAGAIGTAIAIVVDGWYLAKQSPAALIALAIIVAIAVVGRKYLLEKMNS